MTPIIPQPTEFVSTQPEQKQDAGTVPPTPISRARLLEIVQSALHLLYPNRKFTVRFADPNEAES